MATAEPPGQFDIPAPPPAPPQFSPGIDLVVSKRLLWVGGACYPLANIARVYTLTIHPRRKEAVTRFLKRAAIVMAVTIALTIIAGFTMLGNQEAGSGLLTFVHLGAAAAVIYSLVEMIQVVSSQPHFVLAVETSGPSQAVVPPGRPAMARSGHDWRSSGDALSVAGAFMGAVVQGDATRPI